MTGWSNQIVSTLIVAGSGPGSGLFVYAGTPGPGNPPIFWASSAATDPFGNTLSATAGVSGTGTFRAGNTLITPAGEFVYSGTPGLGDLFASIAGAASSDPFGNNSKAGFGTYGGATANQAGVLTQSELDLYTSTAVQDGVTVRPSVVVANATYAGELNVWSGQADGTDTQMVIKTYSSDCTDPARSAPGTPEVDLTRAGQVSIAAGAGPFVPLESFHAVSPGGGMTGLLTGGASVRVKLLPWNAVWCDIAFTWTGVAGGTFNCGNLPSAAYYPNVTRLFPLTTNGTLSSSPTMVRAFIPTSGGLQVLVPTMSASGTQTVGGSFIYPTN